MYDTSNGQILGAMAAGGAGLSLLGVPVEYSFILVLFVLVLLTVLYLFSKRQKIKKWILRKF